MKLTIEQEQDLLELAAKAACIKITWSDTYQKFFRTGYELGQEAFWNSIHSSGDALELATALLMKVDADLCATEIHWAAPMTKDCRKRIWMNVVVPTYEIGSTAATRLAITRAAAEIGRTL